MLALARAFGDGPLPRPRTTDAVFFDLPGLELFVYPVSWAVPLAAFALLPVAFAMVLAARSEGARALGTGASLGVAGVLATVVLATLLVALLGQGMVRLHATLGGA